MVDVDDGYGNVLCVVQTVRRLEAAGAAGIMMEDQRSPLGTLTAGRVAVISKEAAIGKLRAAADSRKDRDFFIIGRTESFWPEGLDSAIDRANAYVEAGADAGFLTGALSVADMARVGREVKAPHNMAMPSGYIPRSLTPAQVREMGFDFTSVASIVQAAAYAMLKYLEAGLADGAKAERELRAMVKDSPVAGWGKFTGFDDEFRELERKYISAEKIAQRYQSSNSARSSGKHAGYSIAPSSITPAFSNLPMSRNSI